ncbi:MAG: DUF1223 domain-containing protein [Polyangiaceae bacterium]
MVHRVRQVSLTFFVAAAAAGLVACKAASATGREPVRVDAKGAPVLVELFSSEGCSSCPPADELLADLDGASTDGTIVALEFHVDYWNRLGWVDPFSKPAWSLRQRDYAGDGTGVFTPQMVVDGTDSFVGSNRDLATQAIARASSKPHASVRLERDGDTLRILVRGSTSPNAIVWVAVAERGHTTAVPRGENAGRTLRHGPVVVSLTRAFEMRTPEGSGSIARPATSNDGAKSMVVAFVQDAATHAVLGTGIVR